MKETSLCYIFDQGNVLLMHRIRKKNDLNEGKWIGIGGKFEENESPEDCVLREVKEETGLDLIRYAYRGIVTFVSDRWEGEHMHLFTADQTEGILQTDCPEGVLKWVPKEMLLELPQWEGDRIFQKLLNSGAPFFSLKLIYRGDTLQQAVLNGTPMEADEC